MIEKRVSRGAESRDPGDTRWEEKSKGTPRAWIGSFVVFSMSLIAPFWLEPLELAFVEDCLMEIDRLFAVDRPVSLVSFFLFLLSCLVWTPKSLRRYLLSPPRGKAGARFNMS